MSSLRILARGRVFRACAITYGLILLVIVFTQVFSLPVADDLSQFVDPALIGMILIATLWGRKRLGIRERRFWDMLALAWTSLLLVDALFIFDLSLPFLSASFTTDVLHVLFYLVFALALEVRPHVEAANSVQVALRRLESVAGLAAFFGVLIYFAIVVLPEPLGVSLSFVPRDRGYTPLLLVRLSLDLLLLGRVIHAASKTSTRWRRLYILLGLGLCCLAIRDALTVLVSGGLLSPMRLGLTYGLFLSLPALFMVLAARTRHLPEPDLSRKEATGDVKIVHEVFRASPLVIYAVIVPALHFLLYPLGLLEPTSRAPREIFCLVFIGIVGIMALVHQRLITKANRLASRELRKAEERLFRSQRLESVGRLAGGIAHDFNNYLTVIRGYCELTKESLADPGARRSIDNVEAAADGATTLTRQLLAFGRRQVLRPEALELNGVVSETGKLLGTLLGEDVALEFDLDPDVGRAQIDLGQVEQVLMNLAVNARDAMPGGGTLSVRTRRVRLSALEATELDLEAGWYASLVIADTGCGMSEEVQAQVFEPFFTTKGQGRGTGLGLSTVHGIVAQSGGAIRLQSAPEQGTTVQVFFPSVSGDVASASPRDSTPQPRPVTSEATILVVEDDDQVRKLTVQALTMHGFRVFGFSGGREAVDRFADCEPVDMLLTDVMMPEMDGIELSEILLSRRPELRVLFMSGYPVEILREREAPFPEQIELLEKPFTPAPLIARVRQVLADARSDLVEDETSGF